jgi:hypothetical protein
MVSTRKCKYGPRGSDGKCPKKPKTITTQRKLPKTQTKKLRPCKYGERDAAGKCPKKSTLHLQVKPNWDSVCKIKKIKYGKKTYSVIVIPKNTYVYRGFSYGDDPSKHSPDPEWDYEKENALEYKKRKNAGIYYATLPIACYYAFNPDDGHRWKHVVMEYKTKQPLHIIDMNRWENLKNIVEEMPELEDSLENTHGFDIRNPTQSLYRFSGGHDSQMTELMREWLLQHPTLDGFGHIQMEGFHSEFTCVDRKKLMEEKEYVYEDKKKALIPLQGTGSIDITSLYFMDGVHKTPFRIASMI